MDWKEMDKLTVVKLREEALKHPEIKGVHGKSKAQLMDELAGTENRIATERRRYNEAVQAYNVRVRSFPANLLAGMFGFGQAAFFEALGPTVDAAMADAEARMKSVLTALKGMGIADKDIQTSNFSISFERQAGDQLTASSQATPGKFQPPAGFYRVSNMVQVKIRDMTKVGDVIETSWGEIAIIAINVSAQTVTVMHGDQTLVLHAGQVVVK